MARLSRLCLGTLVLFYSLNLAPMTFESFTADRIWASNPPESFHMFLGEYGQKTDHYWRIVSPLALLSFVANFIVGWRVLGRRRLLWLGIAFGMYLAIQMSTVLYFVPEQEGLIAGAGTASREVQDARRSVDISELLQKRGRSLCVSLAAVSPPGRPVFHGPVAV
jgi:hypothetical protein